MSSRTLVEYEEPAGETGRPMWDLTIERSASGKAEVLITIGYLDRRNPEEMTITVLDAPKVLAPLIEWLKKKEAE